MMDEANNILTYYIMIECQLLHIVDTEIIDTIKKLEAIGAAEEEVTNIIVQRNILDSIPDVDSKSREILQQYEQLGLIFIYSIDDKPKCCFTNQNVTLFVVILKSVAEILLNAFSSGILFNGNSLDFQDIVDVMCSIGAISDGSLTWMLTCVSKAIMTGIHSINCIRDVYMLFPIKQLEQASSAEMTARTSGFEQARSMLKSFAPTVELLNKSSDQMRHILLYLTDIAMGVLRKQIQQTIQERLASGQKLHQTLCCLYGSMTSEPRFDLQQFVNCVSDLVQLSMNSSQLSDIETTKLQHLAVELISKTPNKSAEITSTITATAAEIDIKTLITNFSDTMVDKINEFNQKTNQTASRYAYGEATGMVEAINKVLTSACNDIVRSIIHKRITKSHLYDLLGKTTHLSISVSFPSNVLCGTTLNKPSRSPSDASRRITELRKELKETRYVQRQSINDARLMFMNYKRNIFIMDVESEVIRQIPNPEFQHTYNPPSRAYTGDHYGAFSFNTKYLVQYAKQASAGEIYHNLLIEALPNSEQPRRFVELPINEHHAHQLKRGRALLRLEINHPTRQMHQGEYVELDYSHHSSCIEQAFKSEKVSQLAKVLAEYDSESRSAGANSSDHGAGMMSPTVSNDACRLFLSSGSSVEAEVHRQLVVERINDGDITTALKLCCIGHQIPFCRDNRNLPISDAQTLRETFEQMLKLESYEQERSKFLSICDEWYRVLEPRGLMNIEQRELLREWISNRQYANIEDPDVALVIEKCLKSRSEEDERAQGMKDAEKEKQGFRTDKNGREGDEETTKTGEKDEEGDEGQEKKKHRDSEDRQSHGGCW